MLTLSLSLSVVRAVKYFTMHFIPLQSDNAVAITSWVAHMNRLCTVFSKSSGKRSLDVLTVFFVEES